MARVLGSRVLKDDTIVNAQEPDVQGGTIDVVLYPGVDGAALHGGWKVVSDAMPCRTENAASSHGALLRSE